MKTAEDYIREMENSNVLMTREYTFKEYVSGISQFQDIICKMVAEENYHEGMRIDEALFMMEASAREKGLRSNPVVNNGVLAVKKLAKEMAITMSGAKGEKFVFRTLEFLNRPNTQIFRNVYISDGIEETELDGIVLTDNGAIILEVKKVKSDLTLTEDGRMVFANDACYDKAPLADRMELKRRLLKKTLEKIVAGKGLGIPVHVDSFIVFSAPKGQIIHVDNRCRREKYCFRTGINKKIENYVGYACYTEEELAQLGKILSEMESNAKRFETDVDYDDVRRSIAEALAVLQNVPEEKETQDVVKDEKAAESHTAKIIELNEQPIEKAQRQASRKPIRFGYAAVSVFAGLLISGAAAMRVMSDRRG